MELCDLTIIADGAEEGGPLMVDYYGDEGCCLTCESAEEGCLCYECKCTKCDRYEGFEGEGYCDLAQQWREAAEEAREKAAISYEETLDKIMTSAALVDEKDRVLLFERLKLDPSKQKTLKKYLEKSKEVR